MKIITLIVALISLTSSAFALTDREIADELFIQLKKQSFMDVQQNLYLHTARFAQWLKVVLTTKKPL